MDGVVHYCVANMPGAVPRTSTFALTNVTLPYLGSSPTAVCCGRCATTPPLLPGVNTYEGHLTCGPVGEALNLPAAEIKSLLPA